jgi:putative alpha-1,2-mannosidase
MPAPRMTVADAPYVRGLLVNGRPAARAWLPESFIAEGGKLEFTLAATPDPRWGSDPRDAPPSFPAAGPGPGAKH